jgi:hypothetical protein
VPGEILSVLVAELSLYGFGSVRGLFAELRVYFGAVRREGLYGAMGVLGLLESGRIEELGRAEFGLNSGVHLLPN